MKTAMVIVSFLVSLATVVSSQTRTVTNADLEKFRQERLRAEAEYRRDYRRLGMPSPEEVDRINAGKRAELRRVSANLERERAAVRDSILSRAEALRSEIAFLRGRGASSGSANVIVSGIGFPVYGYGVSAGRYPSRISNVPPNLQRVYDIASMYPGSRTVFDASRGAYPVFRGRAVRQVPFFWAVGNAGGSVPRLEYLEQIRAGLIARWRLLEEEARRAGFTL